MFTWEGPNHERDRRCWSAPDAPAPESDDAVVKMAHRLKTKAGRALYGLRKQTVEPVFGIIEQVMGWLVQPRQQFAETRRTAGRGGL